MASVSANGITIEYEEEGSGEALLLVMGLTGQLIDWPRPFVEMLLDAGFRVIRFDNRDAGLSTECASEPPTTSQIARAVMVRRILHAEYHITDMADDAAGLLDALGVEQAHVVGMSMGGMIAQSLAIRRPALVRSLASIMSTTGSRRVGQPRVGLVRRLAQRPVPTRETAVESSVSLFREISGPTFDEDDFRVLAARAVERSYRPAGTARQLAAIVAAEDRTPALRKVTAPTLVIHGLLDPLVRRSGGIATASAVPGARLLMFPDMGHDLARTRWGEMAEAITINTRRAA